MCDDNLLERDYRNNF